MKFLIKILGFVVAISSLVATIIFLIAKLIGE